jgi:hypothetical protein
MSELNEGVKIILARMETNPEDFFTVHKEYNPWRWIFDENVREVMTESEKAALYEGIKKVRRLMITHRAIETVMPKETVTESETQNWGSSPMLGQQQMQIQQNENAVARRMQQAAMLQNNVLQNPYQNSLSIGSGGTNICATSSTGTGTLSVGGETLDLDSGMLKKLKNLIK